MIMRVRAFESLAWPEFTQATWQCGTSAPVRTTDVITPERTTDKRLRSSYVRLTHFGYVSHSFATPKRNANESLLRFLEPRE